MEHFVKIAEMKVIQEPGILKTVVGSCIALCIWDKVKKIGGMVHIMMPRSKNGAPISKGKYADTAVHALYDEMVNRDCKKHHLVASIIGGASVFGNQLAVNGKKTIGTQNFETAKEMIQQYQIPIQTVEVGGTFGRRVVFDCALGNITVTMLDRKSPLTMKRTVKEN